MVYRAIGILENREELTIVFSEFLENAGSWSYEIKAAAHLPASDIERGKMIRQFIEENGLQFQVALITFHSELADKKTDGGMIAADTNLPVITDLPALDKALGGNGNFFLSSSSRLQLKPESLSEINKATCVAFMGVLRWREEYNFLSSVTGASRNSIGGALWMGQEA